MENSLRMKALESHVYLVIIKKKLKVKLVGDVIANITDGKRIEKRDNIE